jgi:NAD(P)-dependent dehydrogenase (short-subunit alcohol dehydrogenase family)
MRARVRGKTAREGAAKGIGRASAVALAREGARVLLTAIDPRALLPPPLQSTQRLASGPRLRFDTLFSEGVVKSRIDLSRFVALLRPTPPSG